MKRITDTGLLALALLIVMGLLAACSAAGPEERLATGEVTETEPGSDDGVDKVPGGPAPEASGSEAGSAGAGPTGPGLGPKGAGGDTGGWVDEIPGAREARGEPAALGEPAARGEPAALEAPDEPVVPEPVGTPVADGSGDPLPAASQLTAGEVDDNVRWDEYLLYLRRYDGPAAIPVDVSERHQIWVRDAAGRPVLGAVVRITTAGSDVAVLRTHSDGRVFFFPRAYALPAQETAGQSVAHTVTADWHGASARLEIPAGTGQREWTLQLPVARDRSQTVNLDLLFLLDATGSMGDEIAQLKHNIERIAAEIDALPARPNLRLAMVVYRDRSDAFVARTFEFTPDVAAFAAALDEVEALGGDDYPEDLNTGLNRALQVPEWRVADTVSLIFLVADAPPHLDYPDQDRTYADEMLAAAGRGIKIYPIASSGLDAQGEYIFRQLAQTTGGRFIFLTYGPEGPGSTGGQRDVAVSDYTVAALDDLVLRIVSDELAGH